MPALVRWALPALAALLVVPPQAAVASAPAIDVPTRVTRADILAGRATPSQLHDYLRSSLRMLGFVAPGGPSEEATETEAGSETVAIGGYAYPILAVDLDGDGDEAVLLSQYVGNREHFVAVEGDSIRWRYQLPKKMHEDGLLVGDLSPFSGQEILVVAHRHVGGGDTEFVMGLFGSFGMLWSEKFGTDYPEFAGLVEADGDAESEIALKRYGDGGYEIEVVDGWTGTPRQTVASSFGETTGLGSDEVFVTDGPAGAASEAVFLTWLPAGLGYQAERRRLDDGEVTFSDVVTQVSSFWLSQGPDHTGDGRRDGVISRFDETSDTTGVFDAATLRVAWTRTTPRPADDENGYSYESPYPAGDVDADGGVDLCSELISRRYGPDDEPVSWGAAVHCESGRTGLPLWKVERSGDVPADAYGYGYFDTYSDLDGDGLTDPIFESVTYRCDESGDYGCETLSSEMAAFSGRDASVIWQNPAIDPGLYWYAAGDELDGVAGDDILAEPYSEGSEDADPRFSVLNGLDLSTSWEGTVDTEGNPGYFGSVIGADLDGDGANESVATAYGYEFVSGDPDCWDYCEYEEYVYLAGFAAGGERLWQLEL